mgnify:FL=1
MMSAHVERIYDEYERMAVQAMMTRASYHAKKLKQSDLFKRPSESRRTNKTADDVKERQKAIIAQLERFEEFKGLFGNIEREEDKHGE